MHTQIDLLKKHGLSVRGHLGQHLLIDPNVQRKIVELLEIQPKDNLLEIGPGLGALTAHLVEIGNPLVLIEKDNRFVEILKTEYPFLTEKQNRVFSSDILKFDWSQLPKTSGKTPWKVISNLPYYITAPILFELLERRHLFSRMVLMMQKEVAQRLIASPGTKEYGRLSLALRYSAQVEHAFDVSPHCFTPKPEVASSVVVLRPYQDEKMLPPQQEAFLFHLIKVAFSQRRKMLLRLLSEDSEIGKTRQELQKIFEIAGISTTCRGEELLLKDYLGLCQKLMPMSSKKSA